MKWRRRRNLMRRRMRRRKLRETPVSRLVAGLTASPRLSVVRLSVVRLVCRLGGRLQVGSLEDRLGGILVQSLRLPRFRQ